MQWILSVILFLFVPQTAFPQFNSMEFHQELPSVKVIHKTDSIQEKGELDLGLLPKQIEPTEKRREILLATLPLDDFSMTSGYGYRPDPFSGEESFHRGIDLKTNHSNVFSMLHGKVISVGTDSLLGNFIKVQHGKYEAIYGHLSLVGVSKGEMVLPGTKLGISGSTGRATGDHLHLTIKKGKDYINPTLFIQMISRLTTKEELITYLSQP